MRSLRCLLLLLFCLSFCIAKGQKYSRTAVPLHFQLGLTLANFEDRTGTEIRQGMGSFVQLGAGYSVHLNERWTALSELGASMHNYNFTVGSTSVALTNLNFRVQGGLSRNFPLSRNKHSNLHIGLIGGLSFFQPDRVDLSVVDGAGPNFAVSETLNNPYVGTEIGLSKFQGRNKIEMGLLFNYHFIDSPSIQFQFNLDNSSSLASSKGDYLGLFVRVHLALPESTVDLQNMTSLETKKVSERSSRVPKSYSFKQRRVKLKLKDNAQIDGDTVSIQLNGQWIAKNVAITDEYQTFIVYLNSGANELLLFAENEGTVSPNTASLSIISGWRRQKITTSTSLKRNEVIVLNLQD